MYHVAVALQSYCFEQLADIDQNALPPNELEKISTYRNMTLYSNQLKYMVVYHWEL